MSYVLKLNLIIGTVGTNMLDGYIK